MTTDITDIIHKAAHRIETVEKAMTDLDGKVEQKLASINASIIDLAQKQPGLTMPYMGGPANVLQSVVKSDQLAPLRKGETKNARIVLSASIQDIRKSFVHGDVAGASSDSDLVRAGVDRRPGIAGWAQRQLSILDVMPRLPTSSNTFEFNRIEGYANAAAYQVKEGDSKAQGSVPVELETVRIQTIAHWFKASNQVLADEPTLQSFMQTMLQYGVLEKLERELIAGNGTNSIAGLKAAGNYTVFTPSSGAGNAADKIGEAIAYLRVLGWDASLILLHPNDWQAMRAERATTSNEYLVGSWSSPAPPNVWGVPVVASPAVTEGECFVLDPSQVAILDRQSPMVEIGYVDDDFTRNLVTMRGELRAALAVFAPTAVLYFDI